MSRSGASQSAFACAALLLLSGFAGRAAAQSRAAPDSVLEDLHLKARLAPAPPFVANRDSRAGQGFIPAGRTGAARPNKPMTAAELAAATADLDATRERQQRRAGRKPAIVPDKPPKAPGASRR